MIPLAPIWNDGLPIIQSQNPEIKNSQIKIGNAIFLYTENNSPPRINIGYELLNKWVRSLWIKGENKSPLNPFSVCGDTPNVTNDKSNCSSISFTNHITKRNRNGINKMLKISFFSDVFTLNIK